VRLFLSTHAKEKLDFFYPFIIPFHEGAILSKKIHHVNPLFSFKNNGYFLINSLRINA